MPSNRTFLRGLRRFLPSRPQLFVALLFAVAAALCRASLPLIKTRLQLSVFLLIALTFELFGRRLIHQRASPGGLILNAVVIFLAMLAVKMALDGPLHASARVRAVLALFL